MESYRFLLSIFSILEEEEYNTLNDKFQLTMFCVKFIQNIFFLSILHFVLTDVNNLNNDKQARILGGRLCTNEKYSFMVSIQNDTSKLHLCGGTLLNEYWVLTAAHCCFNSPMRVVAGRDTPGEQIRMVKAEYPHPYFRSLGFIDDIGLMRLGKPINKSKYISFVNIPTNSIYGEMNDYCSEVLVMGWGKLSGKHQTSSRTLQCVNLRVLTESQCRKFYKAIQWVFVTALCTYSPRGDACPGDSGGPAICEDKAVQLGVVSLGRNCVFPTSPGIFTRVDDYLRFIHRTMSGIGIINKFNFKLWMILLCVIIL